MAEKLNQAKARLELIKEKLQNNRKPYFDNGQMIGKTPTLAEWAVEETVCVLLDLLKDEDEWEW